MCAQIATRSCLALWYCPRWREDFWGVVLCVVFLSPHCLRLGSWDVRYIHRPRIFLEKFFQILFKKSVVKRRTQSCKQYRTPGQLSGENETNFMKTAVAYTFSIRNDRKTNDCWNIWRRSNCRLHLGFLSTRMGQVGKEQSKGNHPTL